MFPQARPRIVAIYGGKGGIGKTTTAINLAWCLAEKGTTALMDADYQESATKLYHSFKRTPPFALTNGNADEVEYLVIDMPPSIEEARPLLVEAEIILVPFVLRELDSSALMHTLTVDLADLPRVVYMSRVQYHHRNVERAIRMMLNGLGVLTMETVLREYANAHDRSNNTGIPLLHPEAAGNKIADAQDDMRRLAAETYDLMEAMQK